MTPAIKRVFFLSAGLMLCAIPIRTASLHARSVVDSGSPSWKFLDGGVQPPDGWQKLSFDDSSWKQGKAPLGYGDQGLATAVAFGGKPAAKHPTTWFRRQFMGPTLADGERLLLLLCVDDGAVVYLNGDEVARVNLPDGEIADDTLSKSAINDDQEGFYLRLPIESGSLNAGGVNVLAVEVHQASRNSSDLFLDAAIKVQSTGIPIAESSATALGIVKSYNERHIIGPGVKIPDGYIDGGRGMKIDATRRVTSGRELLRVDRTSDTELADDLAFSRSAELRALQPLERAGQIAAWVDRVTTPPGGMRWVLEYSDQLLPEYVNRPVMIGDWIDQAQSGVCRHRSLLFKLLADEAGLDVALVRGNYARDGATVGGHCWNEISLADGRRLIIDTTLNGARAIYPEVTSPEAIKCYLRVDDTPWYGVRSN